MQKRKGGIEPAISVVELFEKRELVPAVCGQGSAWLTLGHFDMRKKAPGERFLSYESDGRGLLVRYSWRMGWHVALLRVDESEEELFEPRQFENGLL